MGTESLDVVQMPTCTYLAVLQGTLHELPCCGGLKYRSRSADIGHQCLLNAAIAGVRFPYSSVSEVTLPVSGRVAQPTLQFNNLTPLCFVQLGRGLFCWSSELEPCLPLTVRLHPPANPQLEPFWSWEELRTPRRCGAAKCCKVLQVLLVRLQCDFSV